VRSQRRRKTSDQELPQFVSFRFLLFDFIFARNISIGVSSKKFAVNTLLEKYVPNGYWDPNKLGAKLSVIGFYVCRLLNSSIGLRVGEGA